MEWTVSENIRQTFELQQNFIKDKMTERVDNDISWRIFEKNAKKFKIKSQKRENVVFG